MSSLQLCLLVCLSLTSVSCQQSYTTRFDNIDVDQILRNDRLLNNYVNCLLDRVRCTPDGEELKKDLPDALYTRCTKCSPKQRAGTDKVIRFLIEKKPAVFRQLEQKYDPSGYYRRSYSAELARTRG